MRLLRDPSGTLPQAQDSIQRDLTTIQRAIDQLQANDLARKASIDTIIEQLTRNPVSVAVNGQVANAAGAKGLTTVAHDESMFGDGRAINPLKVSASWVAGMVPASGLTVVNYDLALGAITGLNSSPITLVAAPGAGIAHFPIFYVLTGYKASGAGSNYTNGNTSWFVAWDTTQGSVLSATGLGFATTGAVNNVGVWAAGTTSAFNPLANKPLILYTAANITGGSGTPALQAQVRITFGYVTRTVDF